MKDGLGTGGVERLAVGGGLFARSAPHCTIFTKETVLMPRIRQIICELGIYSNMRYLNIFGLLVLAMQRKTKFILGFANLAVVYT